jgi:hypothetical protein
MTNFKEIRNSILEVKAGVEVRSESELSEQLIFLLENSLTAKSMGERGELMVHQNQGAVTRIYELTAELIHQSASSSSGSK